MEIKLDNSKLKFKVDRQKLFQNLFDFDLGSAITEIINKDLSKEAAAFVLLYTVTNKTNVQLSKELDQDAINKADNIVVIYEKIASEWSLYFNEKVVITKDFFDNIIQFNPEYLIKSYNLFTKYLNLINIDVPIGFHYKYYDVFRLNLLEEFNELPEKYSKIADFFANPISEAHDSFIKQNTYYSDIEKYYTTKLQSGVDESKETLQDLYITPFFKIHNKNLVIEHNEDFIAPKAKIDINSFLNDFVLENTFTEKLREKYNMIFILGQPGQGKTSLCYKLVFDILSKTNGLPDTPLFFIKIRDLHAKDFVNDTFNTLKKAMQQNINFDEDKCLLILDGLDEAFMSGGLTDNDLKNLYERLNKASRHNRNLKIILTSRLNYLNINDPSVEGSLVIKMDVLEKEQIKEYLTKFSIFYPNNFLVKKIDEILNENQYNHIEELLQQPVLMYFIALTNIGIEENDSKAKIYDKIFDSLAKRSWDKNGQLKHIKTELQGDHKKYSKYLRKYIRSLAFEIYQSPQLHITMNNLISLDSTKEFIEKCFNDSISSDAEAIKNVSKYLLVSFYFQNSNKSQDGDAAIEFFHNSLWEYLTAEYMLEEYKRVVMHVDDDGDLTPVRIEEYFEVLSKLIGNKDFKSEIKRNLENIISIEKSDDQHKIFTQTKEVFFKLIEKGLLLSYDRKIEKLDPKEKMHNIFDIAWTLFYFSNYERNSNIETNTEFNDFFFNYRLDLGFACNYKNVDFNGATFYEIYFSQCRFETVKMNFDFFGGAIYLNSNIFLNSIFGNHFFISRMTKNSFVNVVFENVIFDDNFDISKNEFKNVKINNSRIPSKNWLNKIIENNSVDKDFIDNHKVISKIRQIENDKKHTVYYITYNKTD